MIELRHATTAAAIVVACASPAATQQGPGPVTAPSGVGNAAPGSGNAAGAAAYSREENESYNRVIGKVGANPVGTEKAKRAAAAAPVRATAADIVAGAAVRDAKGVPLGKIEKVDGDSAILDFNSGKIRFPLIGFGKDANGLLINLTTQDFLAAVAKAKASS